MSIGKTQITLFVLAMASLVGIVASVYFERESFALGLLFGWVIGVFQTYNQLIVSGKL